jgi:SagB-type dehydrogenase family enzyme
MPQLAESVVALPAPMQRGGVALAQALATRRSVREFTSRTLSAREVSQLLWAAQGITHADGYRTAPSAGALFPLTIYIATTEGLFRYEPRGHRLVRLGTGDVRDAMRRAAFGQDAVGGAPAVFAIVAAYRQTTGKYGAERGTRFVDMEVGHAAQNLLLTATALGLGAVPVGAFDDGELGQALQLPSGEVPLYMIPVGEPRS